MTQLMTVIGAGSYGTALAIALSRNDRNITLWGHNPQKLTQFATQRCNFEALPDVTFPDSLTLETDLKAAVQASRDLLIVVPSLVFAEVLTQIQPHLRADSRICWATKGLEHDTGRLLADVAREIVGDDIPLAILSGPTFAKELAAGMPTAIAVSSTDKAFLNDLQNTIHCDKRFRVYANSDFVGMQLGGAVKNVIAIGAGISDGMGFGANARTALITRGLAEMSRLGMALGAQAESFMGMAGLGDLVLTCTDNQSRNRRFGLALGKGQSIETAIAEIGQVVEGYNNTKEVWLLSQSAQIEMPIVEQIYQVLYQGKQASQAALDLLARAKTSEA